jgi:hypothetical protein
MRAMILGILLTLGLACLGAGNAPAAAVSGAAIGRAASAASIVTEVPCAVRRVCGRRGCVARRACW